MEDEIKTVQPGRKTSTSPPPRSKTGLEKLKGAFNNIKNLSAAVNAFQQVYKKRKNLKDAANSESNQRVSFFEGILPTVDPDYLAKFADTSSSTEANMRIAQNASFLNYFYTQSNRKNVKDGDVDSDTSSSSDDDDDEKKLRKQKKLQKKQKMGNVKDETDGVLEDSEINLAYVQQMLNMHADVNVPDSHGQTVLFEVAKTWDVAVAKYLVEVAKADVKHADHYGHTALHVAASCNYSEMIKYLVSQGANMEAPTKMEEQTPIFYAVKSAAGDAIETLIELGCEFDKVTDWRKRTPLFLAADCDRSESAMILLKHGADSSKRDCDGRPAIAPIVNKLPSIANDIALDQYHIKSRSSRKQYYHLGALEPMDSESYRKREWRSVLEIIVDNNSYNLVMHSVIQKFIEVQWLEFGRLRAIGSVIFQLIYLVSWSLLGVTPDWQRRYKYVLKDDWYRIINIIVALVLTLWQIFDEFKEYRFANKVKNNRIKYWTNLYTEDLKRVHPRYKGEIKYLKEEKKKVKGAFTSNYFRDFWNILDWITYALLLTCLITHWIDVAHHTLLLARWHIRIFSITVLILWLRLMKVFQPFITVGPFIHMLGKALLDLGRFVMLYMIFFIPFAFAGWMIMGGVNNFELEAVFKYKTFDEAKNSSDIEYVTVGKFDTINNMIFQLVTLSLVDAYDYANMELIDKVAVQIYLVCWFMCSTILCLNLLIALLSDTFKRVYDNAQAVGVMQRAVAVNHYLFETMLPRFRDRWYTKLQDPGEDGFNPLVEDYDDDISTQSSEDFTKKATIKARTIVRNIMEYMDKNMGENEPDENKTSEYGVKNIYTTTVKNLDVVKKDDFEKQMQELSQEINELRNEQDKFKETLVSDVADIKESCRSIVAEVFKRTQPAEDQELLTPVSISTGRPPLRRRHARAPRAGETPVLDVYNLDGSMYHSSTNQ